VFGLDTVQEESEPDFATSVSSLSASSPVEECQLRETVSPMETMSIDTSSASTDSQSFLVYFPSVLANCRSPRQLAIQVLPPRTPLLELLKILPIFHLHQLPLIANAVSKTKILSKVRISILSVSSHSHLPLATMHAAK